MVLMVTLFGLFTTPAIRPSNPPLNLSRNGVAKSGNASTPSENTCTNPPVMPGGAACCIIADATLDPENSIATSG